MNVDDVVAERIAAARARVEAAKRRRAALNAARQRGLAHRHAQRLRNQANRGDTATVDDPRGAADHAGVGQQPTTASARTTDGFVGDTPSPTNDTEENQ